jgi:hypothetical protein
MMACTFPSVSVRPASSAGEEFVTRMSATGLQKNPKPDLMDRVSIRDSWLSEAEGGIRTPGTACAHHVALAPASQ